MALSKKFRMHRQVPSFYIMATCAVVIALFLIGFWMLLPSSQMAPQDSYLVKDGLPPQRQGIADQAFEKRAKAEENAANSSPKETDAPSKINARETNNVVKDKSESSQDDQGGRADGRNETARDKENNEDIDGVNETSESSQDDKADKGDETTEKDNKNSDAEDNEDENVEKDSSESSPDNRTEKAEQKSGEASDNSDEDNNEDDDGVKDTSASSQDIKVDKAEGTTEDLKDKSAEEARVPSDSTDMESNDEENLVKDTLKSAHYDPVAKPGKEVKDEERLETGTKIENSTTIAAQFELTTENEEIPKNWTTQAVESKEEIELVNIIEERDRESTKKEWNNDKKDQQEQSHNEQKTNQEAVETDKKIINDTVPEVTIAADSELANGNEETPGNRTSQSSESKEEKELIKPQVQEEHGNEKKEWQEQLQDEQNRNEQSIKVKSEEQSQNEQKTQQQSVEEKTEQQKVNLQNQQKSEEQIIEGKKDQPVAKETSEKTGVGAERGEKNKATIQKSLPGGRGTGDGNSFNWKICKWKGAEDYIPCLDNMAAIRLLPSRKHFEHRERHCPSLENFPSCLVPLPPGYNVTFPWPLSREQVRFSNVPHPKLASYKQDQNWMKISADKERILFPGGGTQFKNGALDYINRIERDVPEIAWGNHTRVVLDVGCGVASFGGFLFEKDVLTMSFAPKDEHDAQVQLALERGIPAILAVMGTKRLVSPSNAYDLVHCARCRVHWQGDGGMLLIEINRLLRPGGYFVWSATPVYRKTPEDMKFWNDVIAIADSLCWELKNKTWLHETGIGIAYFQKPISNACYSGRMKAYPPICGPDGKPDAAWYVPMGKCIHEIPTGSGIRASEWPPSWPKRLVSSMSWLTNSTKSLFGQPPATEFQTNTEHWKRIIKESYFSHVGIDWSSIRNVMDMNAGYGGFAAALIRQPLWVMNVVPTFEPDTLPVIFDRGLFGVYHDWCESFNTYPRTYDLLHVDHLFKRLVSRCDPKLTLLEMDRILRPNGWIIFRETSIILEQIGPIIRSLHWQQMQPMFFEGGEGLMVARKDFWRPEVSSVG